MIKYIAAAAIAAVCIISTPSPTQSVEDNPFNNFNASASLDTTQVVKAERPDWLCFDVDTLVTCYRNGDVPYPDMAGYNLIWVGAGTSTYPFLPPSLR